MTLVVRFTIPGKPQPLQRARVGRNGHHYTPPESVEYQEKVRKCAALAGCPLFAPGCEVQLLVVFPDRRTRDVDNVAKGALDALQCNKRLARRAIAWVNDSDVRRLVVEKAVDKANPRVEVCIRGRVLNQVS